MGRRLAHAAGDVINGFTIIKVEPMGKGKHARFTATCKVCGEDWITTKAITLKSNSCGCVRRESSSWKSVGTQKNPKQLPKGHAARNNLFNAYRGRDNARGTKFSFTLEEFSSKIVEPCFYCGKQGGAVSKGCGKTSGDFPYTGLDRIDSNKGYSPENTRPCCKICNCMKNTLTHEEFLAHITQIVKRHL